ncbi:hypothetical protein [Caballeronia zhejiangensis]|uniref:Uncharacterized protein n=1 Tax=Caballeronia zhejiangensis TaxID=871203 RepID=A0A656QA77_9BURK|nr:hypothetical protein [Caballeronia zhejiangensis]KDR25998.1 hypothetical protein BG60_26400 [Caballeronia zhejiangensis]
MTGATLRITLDFDNYSQKSAAYAVRLSDAVVSKMRPVDVCSEPVAAYLSGGNAVSEARYVHEIKVDRELLAKMIAEQVTSKLMEYMESRDRENGYPKARQA